VIELTRNIKIKTNITLKKRSISSKKEQNNRTHQKHKIKTNITLKKRSISSKNKKTTITELTRNIK
jgi:hypothetical protein